MMLDLLSQSTIFSWHRESDGGLKAFIECPHCEIIEEFITVEAATAFGTIHCQDSLHVSRFLASLKRAIESKRK